MKYQGRVFLHNIFKKMYAIVTSPPFPASCPADPLLPVDHLLTFVGLLVLFCLMSCLSPAVLFEIRMSWWSFVVLFEIRYVPHYVCQVIVKRQVIPGWFEGGGGCVPCCPAFEIIMSWWSSAACWLSVPILPLLPNVLLILCCLNPCQSCAAWCPLVLCCLLIICWLLLFCWSSSAWCPACPLLSCLRLKCPDGPLLTLWD